MITAPQLLRDPGRRVDGGPPAEQGTDNGYSGHRMYTREVGHHHTQGWGEDLHAACQTYHLCKLRELFVSTASIVFKYINYFSM